MKVIFLALFLPFFVSAQKKWTNKQPAVKKVKLPNGWSLSPAGRSIPLGDLPLNIAVSPSKKLLAVTNNGQSVQSIQLIDPVTEKVLDNIIIPKSWYGLKFSSDEKYLYASGGYDNWILKYAIGNRKLKLIDSISLGQKMKDISPAGIDLDDTAKKMYVVTKDDNSLYVIDLVTKKIIQREALHEAAYTCLLSGNRRELYISLWGGKKVLVFDIASKKVNSSIDVGENPNELLLSKNGKYLFVANAGDNSVSVIDIANPKGPNPVGRRQTVNYQAGDNDRSQYIAGLMKGTMSIIDEPSAMQLSSYSKQVYENTPYTKEKELNAKGEPGNPVPMKVGGSSPIKHVFYIIKENRTYDQVLGDMPEGNGDTSLVLFGEKITPNHHKIAREFVLFDNFYVDGEVSADGHNWSLAANANDYLEKTWPTSYGHRGGVYDAEGHRDIANPDRGFLWDYCKRAGVSYRTYGEFIDDQKPNIPVLKGHFCPYFTSWDQTVRDTTRANQWKREFDSLVAKNALPQLNTLRLINDHTEGLKAGRPTPFAHVADNDWGVGMFLEYLSHSSVWKESVVFIVEDDAQNGPDHVDAHRSVALVAGPYVKRKFVDHSLYSTSSMLRTIELILGLPPMSQYDAAATPMYKSFTSVPDYTPYKSLPANIDINERNTRKSASASLSETFDFTREDRVPDLLFSQVIWKAVKGEESEMPAPRRSAFVMMGDKDDD